MSEPEVRIVQTWRKVFYASRPLSEDEAAIETMRQMALSHLDAERYLIVGEPKVTVSRPQPPFDFGVDEDGNTYRKPNAVMIEIRVVER